MSFFYLGLSSKKAAHFTWKGRVCTLAWLSCEAQLDEEGTEVKCRGLCLACAHMGFSCHPFAHGFGPQFSGSHFA